MKPSGILFLCGSAEPGRDGVGDYSRRLAAELIRRGIRATVVATHDAGAAAVRQEIQDDEGTSLEVVRIPAATPEVDRLNRLQTIVDRFAPQWISLQFVPWSYSRSGIPRSFARTLGRLRSDAPFEIMFHELWLRNRAAGDLKGRLTGILQRQVVLKLVRDLPAKIVHTHIPINRDELAGRGIPTRALPLFANIGVAAYPESKVSPKPDGTYRVVFFSRLESPPPVQDVLRAVSLWCHKTSLRLEIVLLGGGKAKVSAAAADIKRAVPDASVLAVGYLPADEISGWLSTCDLAISPIPRHSQGKSGTVAAFLEHHLPVISPVVRQDYEPFFSADLNAMVMDDFDPVAVAQAAQKLKTHPELAESLAKITDRFLADLGLTFPDPRDVSVPTKQHP